MGLLALLLWTGACDQAPPPVHEVAPVVEPAPPPILEPTHPPIPEPAPPPIVEPEIPRPMRTRVPDCMIERALRDVPVQEPRIRKDNRASTFVASRARFTRVLVWSRRHHGVVGELSAEEVGGLVEKLGEADIPINEWSASPWPWDAVLLVYTKGNELPFAVHVIDSVALRVSPSDPMSPVIWQEPQLVETKKRKNADDEDEDEDGDDDYGGEYDQLPRPGLRDIFLDRHHLTWAMERFLGPEDPFDELEVGRVREIERRCHPHSGIGEDPWPDLPSARIEPAR